MTTLERVNYFIKKYEAIPEIAWCTHQLSDGTGRHCALGLTYKQGAVTEETRLLNELFGVSQEYPYGAYYCIVGINDGQYSEYHQPHPKQRVLAALYDMKIELTNTVVKYVAVAEKVREETKGTCLQ
jgi:hypothetical protein